MTTTGLRILVVANKTWECDPVVNVLAHRDARPTSVEDVERGFDPLEPRTVTPGAPKYRGHAPPRPRLRCRSGDAIVEVWCIEDWMCTERAIAPEGGAPAVRFGSSSSYEKLNGSLPTIKRHAFIASRRTS